jgi:hypothetical protein
MPIPLSKRCLLLAQVLWSEPRLSQMTARLIAEASENIPFHDKSTSNEMDRIRFSIMKLASMPIADDDAIFDLAKRDWRDLFMAAGFGWSEDEHLRWYKSRVPDGIEGNAPRHLGAALSRAKRWLWRLLVFAGIVLLLWGLRWWFGPIRPMLFYGSNIREHNVSFGYTGDFNHFIVANCSQEDFHAYARQQHLQPVEGDSLPRECPIWGRCDQPWWTPPSTYRGAYYSYEAGGIRRILAFDDGIIYYDISAW